MARRLCIFDLGNVVLDEVDVTPEILKRIPGASSQFLSRYGQHMEELMTGAMGPDTFWSLVSKDSQVPIESDLLADCFNPVPNRAVIEIIDELRETGVRVVCGTNTYESHYELLRESEPLSHFDEKYASHLMACAKPNPSFYQQIIEAEGFSPSEAFFTDDLEENVQAAARLGIYAHRFTDAGSLKESLRRFLS